MQTRPSSDSRYSTGAISSRLSDGQKPGSVDESLPENPDFDPTILSIISEEDWPKLTTKLSKGEISSGQHYRLSPIAHYQQWPIILKMINDNLLTSEHLNSYQASKNVQALNTINMIAVYMVIYARDKKLTDYLLCADIFEAFLQKDLVTIDLMEEQCPDEKPANTTFYLITQLLFLQSEEKQDCYKSKAVGIFYSILQKKLLSPAQLNVRVKNHDAATNKYLPKVNILYYIKRNEDYNPDIISSLNQYCYAQIEAAIAERKYATLEQWLELAPLLVSMFDNIDMLILQRTLNCLCEQPQQSFQAKMDLVNRVLYWKNDLLLMAAADAQAEVPASDFVKQLAKVWNRKLKVDGRRGYVKTFLISELNKCRALDEIENILTYLSSHTVCELLHSLFPVRQSGLSGMFPNQLTTWDSLMEEMTTLGDRLKQNISQTFDQAFPHEPASITKSMAT
jgi:hypothetical protein